jgi:hypothetical protein
MGEARSTEKFELRQGSDPAADDLAVAEDQQSGVCLAPGTGRNARCIIGFDLHYLGRPAKPPSVRSTAEPSIEEGPPGGNAASVSSAWHTGATAGDP